VKTAVPDSDDGPVTANAALGAHGNAHPHLAVLGFGHWRQLALRILADLSVKQALAGDRAALAMGKVDATQTYTKQVGKAPTYEVSYFYQAGGTTYRGHHSCQCEELRIVKEGDSIQVRYARANPEQNLPTLVRYNTT